MAIEIERRFLVPKGRDVIRGLAVRDQLRLRQGYFRRVGGFRIRVRTVVAGAGERSAVLTLKNSRRGLRRDEHAIGISYDLAELALSLLPPCHVIRKTRYYLRNGDGLLWSIDNFEGPNEGLVIAEVELADPMQRIDLPAWIGEEITLDGRYGNSSLALRPIRALALEPDLVREPA
jgi:adenylate cyclase